MMSKRKKQRYQAAQTDKQGWRDQKDHDGVYALSVWDSSTTQKLTYNITFQPIAKTDEGEAEQMPDISEVETSVLSEFKKDNRLTAVADLLTRTIRFPPINRFKLPHTGATDWEPMPWTSWLHSLKGGFSGFRSGIRLFLFRFQAWGTDDRGSFFSFMEKFGFTFALTLNNNKGLLNMTKRTTSASVSERINAWDRACAFHPHNVQRGMSSGRSGRIKAGIKRTTPSWTSSRRI